MQSTQLLAGDAFYDGYDTLRTMVRVATDLSAFTQGEEEDRLRHFHRAIATFQDSVMDVNRSLTDMGEDTFTVFGPLEETIFSPSLGLPEVATTLAESQARMQDVLVYLNTRLGIREHIYPTPATNLFQDLSDALYELVQALGYEAVPPGTPLFGPLPEVTLVQNEMLNLNIPVSGAEPISLTVSGEPEGLTLVGTTLTGTLDTVDLYTMILVATNSVGQADKTLYINVVAAEG